VPVGTRPRPPVRSCRLGFSGVNGSSKWAAVQWAHLNGSGDITQQQLEDFADFAGTAYGSNVIAEMNERCTMTLCEATLYGSDADVLVAAKQLALNGDHVGSLAPANTAIGISWHLAVSYRGGHPRTYVPGVDNGHLENERETSSLIASNLASAANLFHQDVEGYSDGATITSVTHGTMSFVADKEWRVPPVFRRFTVATVDLRLDTQRRRFGPDVPG